MYNQYFSLSAFFNGKWSSLNIHGDTLPMSKFVIKLEHNVNGIALGKSKFYLLFQDFLPDGSYSVDEGSIPMNNISAYNYDGKFLYNIGDIVSATENYIYASISKKPEINDHEYLTCTTFIGRGYVVDITEDKFFGREDTR